MIRKKLDKEKYREWLKNASIYDLLSRLASIKPAEIIPPENRRKSDSLNFLIDVHNFLVNTDKYSESDLVRRLFADIMQRPYVVKFVKYMQLYIATAFSKDLMDTIEETRKQLRGKPINLNNPHFLAWIVIFVMASWELRKRRELGRNPAGYNIDNSIALSWHLSQQKDEELWKLLMDDVDRIVKEIKIDGPEKEEVVAKLFFEKLQGRMKCFENLRRDDLIAMTFGKERDFLYLPNAVRRRAIGKLSPAGRIRKMRERLRKKGICEEEIKERTNLEWQNLTLAYILILLR